MKEKKDIGDILERASLKGNPFGVPHGYFDTMKQEVMGKISATPAYVAQKAEPATFMTYFKPAFTLALMFGLIFGIGYGALYVTGVTQDDQPALQAAKTSSEQLYTGNELTEEEIVSMIGDTLENLYAQESSETAIDIAEPEINKEEIEQYLIDTRISTIALALLE